MMFKVCVERGVNFGQCCESLCVGFACDCLEHKITCLFMIMIHMFTMIIW